MPLEVVIIFSIACLAIITGLSGYAIHRTRKHDQIMLRLRKEADERLAAIEAEHERRLAEIRQSTSSVALDVARTRLLADRTRAQEVVRQANERVADVQRQIQDQMRQTLGHVLPLTLDDMVRQTMQAFPERAGYSFTTTTTTISTPEEESERLAFLHSLPPEEALRILTLPYEAREAEIAAIKARRAHPEPETPTLWDRLNSEEP